MNNTNQPGKLDKNSIPNLNFPFIKLLLNLMFNPSIFLFLQNKKIIQSLLQVMSFCLVASILLTLNVIIDLKKSTASWEKWLENEIQEFGITQEKTFYWKNPTTLPYRTTIEGLQIDITHESINDKPDSEFRYNKHGIWINENSIYFWVKKMSGSGCMNDQTEIIHKQELGSWLLQAAEMKGAYIVSKDRIGDIMKKAYIWASFFLFWTNLFQINITVILFPLCSSILSVLFAYLLKEYQQHRFVPFRKIFVLNLYSAIPPILIATVYCLFEIPGLDFFSIFFIAFFGYQLYIMKIFRSLMVM